MVRHCNLGILPVFIFTDITKLRSSNQYLPASDPVPGSSGQKALESCSRSSGTVLTTSFLQDLQMVYTEALDAFTISTNSAHAFYLIHKGIHHVAAGASSSPLTDVTVAFFPSDPLSYRIAVPLWFFLK